MLDDLRLFVSAGLYSVSVFHGRTSNDNHDQFSLFFADVYVSCVSFAHNVATKDFYIAMVSTNVETSEPEKELNAGLQLLGPIMEK